jgi:hypothetical protein
MKCLIGFIYKEVTEELTDMTTLVAQFHLVRLVHLAQLGRLEVLVL